MIKNKISWKVLEIAIKKKDHNFLARNLIEHLHELGWDQEDVTTLLQKLEKLNRAK
jgi:hypothetical protein